MAHTIRLVVLSLLSLSVFITVGLVNALPIERSSSGVESIIGQKIQVERDIDIRASSELESGSRQHDQQLQRRETITMISSTPTKGSASSSIDPSETQTPLTSVTGSHNDVAPTATTSPESTNTPPPKTTASTTPESQSSTESTGTGLTTPQVAGIIAGGVVVVIAVALLAGFCIYRKKKARAHQKKTDEKFATHDNPRLKRTKSLDFLTMNLEASSNPWNFSPVNVVKPVDFPTGKNKSKKTPELPPFQTEMRLSILGIGNAISKIPASATTNTATSTPVIPTNPPSTVMTVIESPAVPKQQKRRSSISQAMRKMSATFASIVAASTSNSPNPEHNNKVDHSEGGGTFGTRNTPSPWAWGNSINGQPVTPVDYLGKHDKWDVDFNDGHLSKEIEVDELVGVAITERDRSSAMTQKPSPQLRCNSNIPPPRNPPPTSALPIPPKPLTTATPAQPKARKRGQKLPTMTIPVPSATATATANLATFTLLHQSLCRASTVYASDAEGGAGCTCACSPMTISPASSTRYTYCEGMSPTSPASHMCGTNHSSCVWSTSSAGGTPRSSRHTMSLYSLPSTPHRLALSMLQFSSHSSSSGYFSGTSGSEVPPPLPTTPLPPAANSTGTSTASCTSTGTKSRGTRPSPLNLSQKKKKSANKKDHLAGELAELPPSPRRLPEEIERVTREIRERQQEEVLRRLFGEVPGATGSKNATVGVASAAAAATAAAPGTEAPRGRSGSVSAGFGVYGNSWPERI